VGGGCNYLRVPRLVRPPFQKYVPAPAPGPPSQQVESIPCGIHTSVCCIHTLG
jgi:hypothetical protein